VPKKESIILERKGNLRIYYYSPRQSCPPPPTDTEMLDWKTSPDPWKRANHDNNINSRRRRRKNSFMSALSVMFIDILVFSF